MLPSKDPDAELLAIALRKKYREGDRLPYGTVVSPLWNDDHIRLVVKAEIEKQHAICGARSTKGVKDKICLNRAGAGTDHGGDGRCKWHGGAVSKGTMKHGRYSLLRHAELRDRIDSYFENTEIMNIRSAVATAWAVLDTMLEEDTLITPDRAQEIIAAMSKIGTLIKQHHDITEGQKIMIEVPQFMEWAEHLYEMAIKYLSLANGDVRGFLSEAQQYYVSAVEIVTGDSAPALGTGDSDETEELLRPRESESGGEESAEGPDLLRGEVHPPA